MANSKGNWTNSPVLQVVVTPETLAQLKEMAIARNISASKLGAILLAEALKVNNALELDE